MRLGRAAGVSDTGRRRLRNEDAFVCEPPLFAVADGMGGARAGEIAARIAAAALEEPGTTPDGRAGISTLIQDANRRIWERAVSDPATAGMGTTLTAALVDEARGEVTIGHVGDSRAYRLRGGALEQLTTDHSLVAELVQSGVLTPEEAERHPQRSAITRALGTEPSVEVDTFTVAGEPGDVYLLCSDGLPTMVSDDGVAAAITGAGGDLATAAEALVAAANARGGEDNITVVLFELTEGGPDPGEDELEPAAEIEDDAADALETRASDPPGSRTAEIEPPAADVSHHGAGPGSRIGALALIVGALVIGVLGLYWGITK